MKAAVLFKTGEPLQVISHVEISPLKRGQALIKLAFSGVCHSQLLETRGGRGEDRFLPHLLGHEGSGIVVSIGPEVKKIKPGDKVILGWIKGEGIEAGGSELYCKGNRINAGGVTTFSEYSVVSENRCVLLPEELPLDIAVFFGCAIPTGAGMVLNSIPPSSTGSIAIWGLGGIGLSALMATQLFKFSKIIAIDIDKNKLSLAREFGATDCINAQDTNALEEIYKLAPGGVDYCIESAGTVKTIEQAFKSVRPKGGECIFASHPKNGEMIQLDPYDLICGKKICGSWGGNSHPDVDIPKFAQLYRDGRLPLEKLITKRYTLDQINEALDDLENHDTIRPIIEINPTLGELRES